MRNDKARPAVRRLRKATEKPPMNETLRVHAEKAMARHAKRHVNPGVDVHVEKVAKDGYVLASPHSDHDAWVAMICDAFGTRSEATAKVFAHQLTKLCSQNWHPPENPDDPEARGEWCPDETELNTILNFVAGVKPRNEMQAALAAQMCAVHMMTMRASEEAINRGMLDSRTAAIAGKLARTFVMQMDALGRAKGRKTTRQHIRVSYEKHEHKHVHVDRGDGDFGGQPREARGTRELAERPALPRPEQVGAVVRFPGGEGEEGLPAPRRGKSGRAKG